MGRASVRSCAKWKGVGVGKRQAGLGLCLLVCLGLVTQSFQALFPPSRNGHKHYLVIRMLKGLAVGQP